MLKKFLLHFWSLRRQFIRYFIIGFTAFILDMTSLFLLRERLRISQVVVIALTQPIIISYVFFLNKYWSFKSVGVTRAQFIRFIALVGFNYIFSIFWMWLLSERLQINYLFTRFMNIALAVTWNFLLYKYWVYKTVDNN